MRHTVLLVKEHFPEFGGNGLFFTSRMVKRELDYLPFTRCGAEVETPHDIWAVPVAKIA